MVQFSLLNFKFGELLEVSTLNTHEAPSSFDQSLADKMNLIFLTLSDLLKNLSAHICGVSHSLFSNINYA